MPEMTNAEALQALVALRELADKPMAAPAALKVRRMIRALNAHAEDVEAERMKMLRLCARTDEHGEIVVHKDEPGQPVEFADDEARDRFLAFYQELLGVTHHYDVTLRGEELGKVEVAPRLLLQLGALLED
jgi:hypothetical protein